MSFDFEDMNEPKIINEINKITDELNIFNQCHIKTLENNYIKCTLKNTEEDIFIEITFDENKEIYSLTGNIDLSTVKYFEKYTNTEEYEHVLIN
jgi:hypothetical protein